MKSKDTLISLYHAGQLSEADQKHLESMLAANSLQLEELDLQEEVMDSLLEGKEWVSTEVADNKFYTFLEKQGSEKARVVPFSISRNQGLVAAIVAVLLAFWGGLKLGALDSKGENSDAKQELLSIMLDTEDVSERIHLISTHQVDKEPEKQVLDALLFSLIHDESNNVRLAAIEVLRKFSGEEEVREGMIRAIAHQHSTIVLIEIAQVLKQGGKKISTEEFFTYINKDMHPVLQKNLREALKHI